MKISSLCYIENDGKYLMLYRNAKKNDENAGKWIGIGGKFEDGESPEDCVCREVLEETGLTLVSYDYRGIVTFVSDKYGTEYMHLFTSDKFDGEISTCSEGRLEWIDKNKLDKLPMWEGDRVFLALLDSQSNFFSLKLCYEGDTLKNTVLDGKKLDIL